MNLKVFMNALSFNSLSANKSAIAIGMEGMDHAIAKGSKRTAENDRMAIFARPGLRIMEHMRIFFAVLSS